MRWLGRFRRLRTEDGASPISAAAAPPTTAPVEAQGRQEAARVVPIATMGELVAAAQYFRGAMESRRSVELRAAVIVGGFDLLLVKSFLDYSALRSDVCRAIGEFAMVAGLVLYANLVIAIERISKFNRAAYRKAENVLRARLEMGMLSTAEVMESMPETLRTSWAAMWPGLAVVGVTVGSLASLYFMPR